MRYLLFLSFIVFYCFHLEKNVKKHGKIEKVWENPPNPLISLPFLNFPMLFYIVFEVKIMKKYVENPQKMEQSVLFYTQIPIYYVEM